MDPSNLDTLAAYAKAIDGLKSDLTFAFGDIRRLSNYVDHIKKAQVEDNYEFRCRIYDLETPVKFIKRWAKRLAILTIAVISIIGIAAIISCECRADDLPQPEWRIGDFHVLDVDRVSIEQSKIRDQRDGYYLIDDDNFTTRTALDVNFRVATLLYMNNDFHMMSTSDRVRAVGWQWEAGVHAMRYADVFWFHHSQHVLERNEPTVGYPLENRYGVRINLINK